jgi:nitrilase
MKIAAIQMVSGVQVDANLTQACKLVAQAAANGAELVVLPEYFSIMGQHDTDKLQHAEPFGQGRVQHLLSQTARQLQIWLVGGTIPLQTDDPLRVTNTCLVWSPLGQCVARYDKIHLFQFQQGAQSCDESRVLRAGQTPVSFDCTTRAGDMLTIGLSICYDLRFPELYRSLPCHLWLLPAAFTWTTGQAHWECLLRARAIENQVYVLASAQGGHHDNGRQTWGQSMIIDPWGDIVAQQAPSEQGVGVVSTTIDLAHLQRIRQQLPALTHRVIPLTHAKGC